MLRLLIEVPNAAGRGRRIVTSVADPGTNTDPLASGRAGSEGRDYIAVEWHTSQQLENRTVRDDDERFMLVGVDTSRLSIDDRERVRGALRQLRAEIEQIVGSIDWDSRGHGILVTCPSLADLLRRPPFSDLPLLEESAATRPSAGLSWRLPAIAACVAGLLAAAVCWILPDVITPPPQVPTPHDRIQEILGALRCSEDDLKRWIAAARGLSQEDAKQAIGDDTLRRLTSTKGVERFFVYDQTPIERSQLRDFIASLGPTSAIESEAIRASLQKAHTELLALRLAAEEVGNCDDWMRTLQTDTTDRRAMSPVAITFIATLAGFATESSIANTAEPDGPFFDADDHRRFTDLTRFFNPERRSPIEGMSPIRFSSDKQSEALLEVAESISPTTSDFTKLTQAGDDAYARTDCKAFQSLVEHFNSLCRSLAGLRKPEAPDH